jgi:hypothetical protein
MDKILEPKTFFNLEKIWNQFSKYFFLHSKKNYTLFGKSKILKFKLP